MSKIAIAAGVVAVLFLGPLFAWDLVRDWRRATQDEIDRSQPATVKIAQAERQMEEGTETLGRTRAELARIEEEKVRLQELLAQAPMPLDEMEMRHEELRTLIAEADGRAAVRLALERSPDVVLMDVSMPVMNGIEATRLIAAETQGVKVLGLSMHADGKMVRGMLQAGASGYVLKDRADKELANAIHAVVAGRTYLSPEIAGVVPEVLTLAEGVRREQRAFLSVASKSQLDMLAGTGCREPEPHSGRSKA